MRTGRCLSRRVYRERSRAPGIRLILVCGLILTLAPGATPVTAQPVSSAPEYRVKAAFLLNFAKFVDWPSGALGGVTEPIHLGIIGRDPFGSSLDRLVEGHHISGRKVVVERLEDLSELESCHILFVAVSDSRGLSRILDRIKDKPILSVGESRRFLDSGGMIQFKLVDRKVRFEIDLAAAQHSGLKVSSRLMDVSDGGRRRER